VPLEHGLVDGAGANRSDPAGKGQTGRFLDAVDHGLAGSGRWLPENQVVPSQLRMTDNGHGAGSGGVIEFIRMLHKAQRQFSPEQTACAFQGVAITDNDGCPGFEYALRLKAFYDDLRPDATGITHSNGNSKPGVLMTDCAHEFLPNDPQ